MYCENCGGKLSSDDLFCPSCGCKVDQDERVNTAHEELTEPVKLDTTQSVSVSKPFIQSTKADTPIKARKKGLIVGVICCCFVLVAIAVILIIVLGNNSNNPTTAKAGDKIIVDVDSSELPESLYDFIYAFDFGYSSTIGKNFKREYDCENLDEIYDSLVSKIANHPSCVNLDLYPGEDTEEKWDLKADPLGKFDQGGTISFDEDKVLWVMNNIFNIPEDTAQDMLNKALETDDNLYEYEQNGNKRLYHSMGGIGDIGSLITYDTIRYDGERYYIVYHRTMMMYSYGDSVEPETYYIEVSEKEIDGQKYWSIYRHSENIPEIAEPTAQELSDEDIFSKFEGGYTFTAGIGYWSSHIELKSDGTFTGDYHDSNMGESGDGYDTTQYQSEFTGRFINPKKINDYTYSFELDEIIYKNTPGTEEIQDMGSMKMLVKYSEAYGIAGDTKTVYAYTSNAPTLMLPEPFMTWVGRLRGDDNDNAKLLHRCLYAVEIECGWIGPKEEQ